MPRILAFALLLIACAREPVPGAPPALLPIDEILAAVPAADASPADALAARGDSLRARAARLRAATP